LGKPGCRKKSGRTGNRARGGETTKLTPHRGNLDGRAESSQEEETSYDGAGFMKEGLECQGRNDREKKGQGSAVRDGAVS